MFPAASKKKDGTGHVLSFPDVCKTPAPPAPFTPVPYPNVHGKKLSSAKTKVKTASKQLVKMKKVMRGSGDEAGVLKGLISMKNMEKVINAHEKVLKQAPRLDFKRAQSIQKKFEKDVAKNMNDLEKALGKRKDLQKLVRGVKVIVTRAARGQ